MGSLDYTAEQLPNGLRLCWLNLPQAERTAVVAQVPAGIAYETKSNNGVSHLLEHLHLAVTPSYSTRPALARALDTLCGMHNAQTRYDCLAFFFETRPLDVGKLAGILAEILTPRAFPAEIVGAELRLLMNEVGGRGSRFGGFARLFGKHPFGLPAGGTRRSLKRLTARQIEDFDKRCFRANAITVAIVGRVLEEQLDGARRALSGLAPSAAGLVPPEAPRLNCPIVRVCPARQADLFMGFVLPSSLNVRQAAVLLVIEGGLSSISGELFERMRYGAAGTYHYRSDVDRFGDTRVLWTWGWHGGRRSLALVRAILDEIDSIRTARVAQTWLPAIRQKLLDARQCALEALGGVAWRIADGEMRRTDPAFCTLEEELDLAAAVTPNDLAAFAEEHFTPQAFFLVLNRVPLWHYYWTRRLVRRYLGKW